jgi:hypothetical protein
MCDPSGGEEKRVGDKKMEAREENRADWKILFVKNLYYSL